MRASPFTRPPWLLAVLTVFAAGCTDIPTPSQIDSPPDESDGDGGTRLELVAVTCRANVASEEIICDPAIPATPGVATNITIGGQDAFIRMAVSGGSYNSGTQVFSFQVRLRNLIPQSLGTTDGVTLAPGGVRIFLQSGPSVTAGSGAVRVLADGVGSFTGGTQPYFQYNQVIAPHAESGPKLWQFSLPPTVLNFVFTALVSAPVQYPDGWVDVAPTTFTIRPTESWMPTATVRSAFGTEIPNQEIAWSTADSTLATVSAQGVVTGVRAGFVQITAASNARSGSAAFTVTPMARSWTGAVSSDWHDGNNWSPVGVVPTTADTAFIPAGIMNPYPILASNASTGTVLVENGALITLGAFDLIAGGDVLTGTSGGIEGTSGRLFLAGTARTVQGVLPRVRVTGTYSLVGNLTARAPLRVESGRLRNASFRVRTTSF